MNADKILFPTDFSSSSNMALQLASSLASETGASLYIIHVDDETPGLLPTNVGYGYVPAVDKIAKQEYESLLKVIPTRENVPYEHCFFRGDAAEQILRFANEEKVDFIVLGTHGRTGARRMLMGSVAEKVVRRAECPVLTVREPDFTTEQEKPAECQEVEQ